MGLFGVWVSASTVQHAVTATIPHAETMGVIGLLALMANVAVAASSTDIGLLIVKRYRFGCARNDCVANIAVIAAGAGVWWSGTQWPDIAVTVIIAYLGMSSALRVIRLSTRELQQAPALMRMPAE